MKNERKKLIIQYTLWFILFACICVIGFFLLGRRSMFTIADGIYQQYAYFLYVGKWIRELAGNIFVKHIFELPMWDMTIGMGSDPLISLSAVAYPLTDPIYWISVFVPLNIAEYVFNAVIVFKLYLSGLAFLMFSRYHGRTNTGSVAGAMVYAFSAVIYISFTQAYFINVFYFFPILMIGVDLLWTRKRFKLYVITLALCVMYSYYFTYMMGLLVIAYCIIRVISERKQNTAPNVLSLVIRFIVYSLIGAGIGVGFQLPAMMNLSGLDRLSMRSQFSFFSFNTLKEFIFHAFSNGGIAHEGFWGVSPILVFCLLVLFAKRGEQIRLKVIFVIYTLSFFIPFVGSVFNGLNFPTGRYVFGYLLLISYIVALGFDQIRDIKKNHILIVAGAAVILMLSSLVLKDINGILSAVSLLFFTGSVLVGNFYLKDTGRREKLFMIATLVSAFIISYAHFQIYLLSVEVFLGNANNMLIDESGIYSLSDEAKNELTDVRYDYVPFVFDAAPVNSSMISDLNGFDFYNSNYNNDVDHFYTEMGIISDPIGYMLTGLRGRTYLEMLCGSRYVILNTSNEHHISAPYQYDYVSASGDYEIYSSANDISLVYFYDEALPYSVLEGADPIEAEDLMMKYCFTEDASAVSDVAGDQSLIEYEITDHDGIIFDENGLTVEKDGFMVLSFDHVSDSEIILLLDGIRADSSFVITAANGYEDDYLSYDFTLGKAETDVYYHWKDIIVFDFGVWADTDSVKIIFNSPAHFDLDEMKIYARSTAQLDSVISAFNDHADAEAIEYDIDCNHIRINATADQDKYLYLAVPYSKGWTAYVDGEKTEVLRANTAFMAIPVKAGDHTIEFSYQTPYLKTAVCVTTVSLGVFVALSALDGKRRKNEKTEN